MAQRKWELTIARALKGGDPFVLGRGGEEALALAKAGVPFEVIPGVSAAIAAPALSGIPVTHRGLSSGFVVVSGHAEEGYRPVLEPLAPNSLTVVILMGLAQRAAIASLLIARGWRAETPAAIAFAASTDDAFTWTGTLDRLCPEGLGEVDRELPGTIVIGEVVALASVVGTRAALGASQVVPSPALAAGAR